MVGRHFDELVKANALFTRVHSACVDILTNAKTISIVDTHEASSREFGVFSHLFCTVTSQQLSKLVSTKHSSNKNLAHIFKFTGGGKEFGGCCIWLINGLLINTAILNSNAQTLGKRKSKSINSFVIAQSGEPIRKNQTSNQTLLLGQVTPT